MNNINKFVFSSLRGGGVSFGYCEVGTEKLNVIQANVMLQTVNYCNICFDDRYDDIIV